MNVDPILAAFVVVILLIGFAVYLVLRRTMVGFREGLDRGRR